MWSKLFSESSEISMMRLMSLLALLTAMTLAFMDKPGYDAFLVAAFGGKVAQKFAEVKNG